MPKVLILSSPFLQALPEFEPELTRRGITPVSGVRTPRITQEALHQIITDFDAVVVGGTDKFDRALLEKARGRVRLLVKWGVGIDNIDLAAAEEFGMTVRYSPGLLAEPVANMAIGYLLMLARGLHIQNSEMHAGRWTKVNGVALEARTVGVIGVGAVGRRVLEKAAAFGMRLVGCDTRPPEETWRSRTGVTMASLEELLADSDFVVLCASGGGAGGPLINESALKRMKQGAYLINVARGQLVEEPALASALTSGHLAGAGLDVFEKEPLPAGSPLRGLPNCILSPHNANSEDRANWRVSENTVRHLLENL